MYNYAKIYNGVYKANPGYSARDNSPGVRYFDRAYTLLKTSIPDVKPEKFIFVADIGGGQGLLKDKIPQTSYSVIDVSSRALDLVDGSVISRMQADITGLLPNSVLQIPFDIGFCFDVLEHLDQVGVSVAIQNLAKICPLIIGSISMRKASNTDYRGRNLHATVEGVDFWQTKLKREFSKVFIEEVEDCTLLFAVKR